MKTPSITVYSVERKGWYGPNRPWVLYKREAVKHGPNRVTVAEYPGLKCRCILSASRAHGLPELALESTRESLELAVTRAEQGLAEAKAELASLPPLGELEVIETKLPT